LSPRLVLGLLAVEAATLVGMTYASYSLGVPAP
jgi:hypothetical protein